MYNYVPLHCVYQTETAYYASDLKGSTQITVADQTAEASALPAQNAGYEYMRTIEPKSAPTCTYFQQIIIQLHSFKAAIEFFSERVYSHLSTPLGFRLFLQ